MNLDLLKEFLKKIPVLPLMVAWAAYLGFDYTDFQKEPTSPYVQTKEQIKSIKIENEKLKKKVTELEAFEKTLEERKNVLRNYIRELGDLKNTLSETFDEAPFLHDLEVEARRVQIFFQKKSPAPQINKEHYDEIPFEIQFAGIYGRILQFLNRIANLKQVSQITKIVLSPTSTSDARFVRLQADAVIKAYRYHPSKADEIKAETLKGSAEPTPPPAPVASPKAPGGPS